MSLYGTAEAVPLQGLANENLFSNYRRRLGELPWGRFDAARNHPGTRKIGAPGPQPARFYLYTNTEASLRVITGGDDFQPQVRQSNVLYRRKAAHPDGANHLTVFPDGNAAAPSDETPVSVKGNVEAFHRIANLVANVLGG